MITLTVKEQKYLRRLESISRCLGEIFNIFNLTEDEIVMIESLIRKKYISGRKYSRKEIGLMEYRDYRKNGYKAVSILVKRTTENNGSRKIFNSKQRSYYKK